MARKVIRDEIEEILVDCHDEDEQAGAWEVTFQDEVKTPFTASLLGDPVEITQFRLGTAICMQCLIIRGDRERWISIEDLDDENLPADFRHATDLYRAWSSGDY